MAQRKRKRLDDSKHGGIITKCYNKAVLGRTYCIYLSTWIKRIQSYYASAVSGVAREVSKRFSLTRKFLHASEQNHFLFFSVFPTTATPLLAFAREVISLHQQQRVLVHPILVHCYAGVGLSGMLCLLIAAILDLTANPTSIPDLTALAVKLSVARKNILRDREHLKFAYLAFLSYLNELRGLGNTLHVFLVL